MTNSSQNLIGIQCTKQYKLCVIFLTWPCFLSFSHIKALTGDIQMQYKHHGLSNVTTTKDVQIIQNMKKTLVTSQDIIMLAQTSFFQMSNHFVSCLHKLD